MTQKLVTLYDSDGGNWPRPGSHTKGLYIMAYEGDNFTLAKVLYPRAWISAARKKGWETVRSRAHGHG
jgi:hypothetical protein